MYIERQVRLLRNKGHQVIPVPREFELNAREVIVRREDDHLVIEPVRTHTLLKTLARLKPLDEEFPDVDGGLLPLDNLEP
jgi:antitoxin VapB